LREQAYRQRTTDPKAVTEATRELKRMELEEQYQAWVDEQVERAIAAKYPPAQVSARLQQLKKEILATHPGLYAQARQYPEACPALEEHARRLFRQEVRSGLDLLSFAGFLETAQVPLF